MSQHQEFVSASAEAGVPLNWVAPRPSQKAHVIKDDAEAVAVAQRLAPIFAAGAAERDRTRSYSLTDIDLFSQSGLWSITIPKEFGGAAVSQVTVAKVFATLAAADPSLTQLAQNHFEIVDVIRVTGSPAQKRDLFGAFSMATALATPSLNRAGRMSRISRRVLRATVRRIESTGRSSTRQARSLRISCPWRQPSPPQGPSPVWV